MTMTPPGARPVSAAAFRPPAAATPLLLALAALYGALAGLRRAAYRRGWCRVARPACPVISVGNLAVGGSGKTPLVDWLLRAAQAAGRRPACLSRGYGGRTKARLMRVRAGEGAPPDPVALGDEPAMLARRNPGVPVYVGRRRRDAARLAAAWDRPGLLVLDDGLQHLALARDLELVLVDAERGLGNGRLLPAGPLREPLSVARRADAVLVSKANLGDGAALVERLRAALGPAVPVFCCDYRAERLRRLDGGATLPPQALAGRGVSLVCAIAQPEGFRRTVEGLGARVEALHAYPDHHGYGPAERAWLDAALDDAPAGAPADAPADAPGWLTTEKDAVKLEGHLRHAGRLWVLEMAVAPEPAAEEFLFAFLESGRVD